MSKTPHSYRGTARHPIVASIDRHGRPRTNAILFRIERTTTEMLITQRATLPADHWIRMAIEKELAKRDSRHKNGKPRKADA